MKTIKYRSNLEMWKLEKELKEKGFIKTSDRYWYQNFRKENDIIILERI